jgi:hypothetical protein
MYLIAIFFRWVVAFIRRNLTGLSVTFNGTNGTEALNARM